MSDLDTAPKRVLLEAYMAPITPINPQPHPSKLGTSLQMYFLGRDADDESNWILCDETNGGGHWNFCKRHEFVYPRRGKCQMCQAAVAEPATQGSVTTSNAVLGE